MPQVPTDPDAWLASRRGQGAPPAGGAPTSPTDPDEWLASRQQPSILSQALSGARGLISSPDPWGDIKAVGRGMLGVAKTIPAEVGSVLYEAAKDPHVALPTIGGMATGLATESPFAIGAGSAAGEAGADIIDYLQGRTPQNVTSGILSQFAGGTLGAAIPLAPGMRALETPEGEVAAKVFGRHILPYQRTSDAPILDFLTNIAEGMTGSSRMAAAKEAQAVAQRGTMLGLARGMAPTYGFNPDVAAQKIRVNAATAFDQAQRPLNSAYKDFMDAVGGLREPSVSEGGVASDIAGAMGEEAAGKGPTVAQMHARRSDLLQRGRDALAAGDTKTAFEANQAAGNILDRMKNAMGPDASRAYDQLGSQYRQVMETYDNPLMNKIRRGVHPEQLADMILNPEGTFPKMTPLGQKVSQPIPQMLQGVKKALPAESWQELKASTLQRLYENAVKFRSGNAAVGMLDATAVQNQIKTMGDGAFNTLFEDSAGSIRNLATGMAQAQRATGQTGKFFIDLRQAGAVSAIAGATAATLMPGGYKEKAEAGLAGALVPAATFMVAPWALARIMTSPTLSKVFIRGLAETDPTVKAQIAAGLTKALGQMGGAEVAGIVKSPSVSPPQTPSSIGPPLKRTTDIPLPPSKP